MAGVAASQSNLPLSLYVNGAIGALRQTPDAMFYLVWLHRAQQSIIRKLCTLDEWYTGEHSQAISKTREAIDVVKLLN